MEETHPLGKIETWLESCLKNCPIIFHLCFDPIGNHKKSRAFFGFLLGFTLGFLLHVTIIADMQFDSYTSAALGLVLITMLSVGCALSIQVRCISLLTIPAFLGRAGRGALRALILGYLITGPIFNLTYNGKEVVRTFACTAELTYNLTRTRYDLAFKPFQEAIMTMKADGEQLKDALSSVREMMSPIVEEIEGEQEMLRLMEENDYLDELQGDSERSEEIEERYEKKIAEAKTEGDVYEAKYKKKMEARCEEQLSRGSERCRNMFGDAYNKCYETVTVFVAWLLCWPMKLTFVCNLVQAMGGASICNPDGKIDAGLGEGYASLKATRDKLTESMQNANLQYKVKIQSAILDVHTSRDTAKAIMYDFNSRKRLFEQIMTFIKRCLSFVFLRIILSAQKYHDKYLSQIEHDNIYITPYFRRIDARRKARGSPILLPLKKAERVKYVDPYDPQPGKAERVNLMGQSIKLMLELITATTFVLFDRLFFETLDLIRQHARMEFTQSGYHDMTLNVRGTGVIASLVRSVIHGFNVKKRVKTAISNKACLPRPTKLSGRTLFKIYGTYFAIWLMILVSSYTQRLRRSICSFFYRKHEKRRVLYLYNETLRSRLGYAKFIKRKIRADVRSRGLEHETNPWMALKLRSPNLCGWLKFFACARPNCLICGDKEPRRGEKFRECETPGCPFVYCSECWRDIGEICYACVDFMDDTNSESYESPYTEF